MNNIRNLHVRCTSYAHICAVECVFYNGVTLIMAVIFIIVNNKMFIYFHNLLKKIYNYNPFKYSQMLLIHIIVLVF